MLSSSLRCILFLGLLTLVPGTGHALADFTGALNAGWTVESIFSFDNPQAARLNPMDGQLYVLRLETDVAPGEGGVYRVDPVTGAETLLASAFRPRGLAIASNGDVFFAEGGQPGELFKVPFGQTGSVAWTTGFKPNDSDPIGMAIAPQDFSGYSWLAVGEGLVADEGSGQNPPGSGTPAPTEVYRWSPTDKNVKEVIVPDQTGEGAKLVDVAIGSDSIYLVDQGFQDSGNLGSLFRIEADKSLTELLLEDVNDNPLLLSTPIAVAVDPLTGELLVADATLEKIFRVSPDEDPVTKRYEATVFGSGFLFGDGVDGASEASGLGFSLAGDRLVISERGTGTIYVLSSVPEPAVLGLLGMGAVLLAWCRRESRQRR